MADTNHPSGISVRVTFPHDAPMPASDVAVSTRSQANSVGRNSDAEKAIRALIAVYLRPPTHISSCFHCW